MFQLFYQKNHMRKMMMLLKLLLAAPLIRPLFEHLFMFVFGSFLFQTPFLTQPPGDLCLPLGLNHGPFCLLGECVNHYFYWIQNMVQ